MVFLWHRWDAFEGVVNLPLVVKSLQVSTEASVSGFERGCPGFHDCDHHFRQLCFRSFGTYSIFFQ